MLVPPRDPIALGNAPRLQSEPPSVLTTKVF
jgi:hypothetical protein